MAFHGGSGGSFSNSNLHGGSGGSFSNSNLGISTVPPVGTSAYKAYQRALQIDPGASAKPYSSSPISSSGAPLYSSALDTMRGPLSPSGSDDKDRAAWMWSVYMGNGQHGGSGAGSASPGFDYLDAPWASAYGMSPETAYSEAMENTAYRRSVTDMKAAGLNPASIFGAGNGSTAGSPGYISSSGGGGGGGGGGGNYRRRSGSGSNGKLFSSSAYSVLTVLGGIAGAVATKSAGGYWLGASVMQGSMNALNALSKWKK